MKIFKLLSLCAVLSVSYVQSTSAASEVIGEYANGCIAGAVALKPGDNYQLQVWAPNRNYGHPTLIDFIQTLVKNAKANNLPDLLIGDLSGPVGGSFGPRSSHGSHQSGLDVDISFDFSTPKKTAYELSHPQDVFIVDTKNRITKYFDKNRVALIYLAASDPRVERIFVAPGIKKALCDIYENKDRSWLSKVRPWFGHRGHMHVRLACPPDSPNCKKQDPVPQGDGCGYEVDTWINPQKYVSENSKPKPVVRKKKEVPEQCLMLFKNYTASSK